MNDVWSEYVQGIMTLYLSRKLRFDDIFFEQYNRIFSLDPEANLRILEIGCGPGALAEALHRWYPNAEITAIDRDSNFISFAQNNIPGVTFMEGDATKLPFTDNFFDITISNTVQEHVEPTVFWGEQRRVLKPGGICLCLSARKGLHCQAPCMEMTSEEKEFWESISQAESELEKYGVCQYPMSEAELPTSMQENGFADVSTGYAVIDLTPDAPKYPSQIAELMIESKRQIDLEAIKASHHEYDEKVIKAINEKYDERLRLYHKGIKQWDTSVSLTMIVRGIKARVTYN